MLPDTLAGLALFSACLLPGFVFLQRREAWHPGRSYSSLRETSIVLVASACADLAVITAFGLVRLLAPSITPDVGAWVRQPAGYLTDHYLLVGGWCLALLGVACCLSAVWAVPPRWIVERTRGGVARRHLERLRGSPQVPQSGWVRAFSEGDDDTRCVVGLALKDGTYLHGALWSYSSNLKEDGDRSIALASPVQVRASGDDTFNHSDAAIVVVAASEVSVVYVWHLADGAAATAGTGTGTGTGDT